MDDEFENDPVIEERGIITSIYYAEAHWDKLVNYNIARREKLKELQTFAQLEPHFITKYVEFSSDDKRLYYCFRSNFPLFNVQYVFEEDIKNNSTGAKEQWRNFMVAMDGRIEDYNQLSLLRVDPTLPYTPENSILVPRIQFVCIEIARNFEGANNFIYVEDITKGDSLIPYQYSVCEKQLVEMINKIKEKLEEFKNVANYNPNDVLEVLSTLSQFCILSKPILKESKIGVYIRGLSKHFQNQVPIRTSALSLIRSWKKALTLFSFIAPSLPQSHSPSPSLPQQSNKSHQADEPEIVDNNNVNDNVNNNVNNINTMNIINSQFSNHLANVLVDAINDEQIIDRLFLINGNISPAEIKNEKIEIEITLSPYSYLFASKIFLIKLLFPTIQERETSPRYKLSLSIDHLFPFISSESWAILRIIHLNFEELSSIFNLSPSKTFIPDQITATEKAKILSQISNDNEFALLSSLRHSLAGFSTQLKERYLGAMGEDRKQILKSALTVQQLNAHLSHLISSLSQSPASEEETIWREKGIQIVFSHSKQLIIDDNQKDHIDDGDYQVEKELNSSLFSLEKIVCSSTFEMFQSLSQNGSNSDIEYNFIWREIYRKIFNAELINITNKIGVEKQAVEASSPSSYPPPSFGSSLLSSLSTLQPTKNIHVIGNDRDIVVIDEVISQDDSEKLFATLSYLVDCNFMKDNFQKDVATRFDQITWLSEYSIADFPPIDPSKNSSQKIDYHHLMNTIKLIKGMGGVCEEIFGYKLVIPKQCMAACYDGNGAHYVAHHDNVCHINGEGEGDEVCDNHRLVTVLLYVNPFWAPDAGGHLRCYVGDQPIVSLKSDWIRTENAVEIEPIAGRMVIFKSRELLHEVCPSFARRMAISCWLLKNQSTQ